MSEPEKADPYRNRAQRILIAIALIAVAGFFSYKYIYPLFSSRISSLETSAEHFALQKITQQFSAPEPLRAPVKKGAPAPPAGASKDQLTLSGTINWTNTERGNSGLPPLKENSQLDVIAKLRLEDMFKGQYFAHVSPASSSAITIAESVGYDYLALGENIALGNFGSDEKLVEAWMGSPGHRANILNSRYREIGVAVGQGMFEGDSVWIAVQVFGTPASACPQPDAALKAMIESGQSELQAMQQDLAARKADIDNTPPGREYNAKVRAYNDVAAEYNALLNDIKAKITQYNSEVAALNSCIGA